eukprot:scaffold474321_cov48-Prasinocladus_malaysianus.AAC.1
MSRNPSLEGEMSHQATPIATENNDLDRLWGRTDTDGGFVLLTDVPQEAYGRMKVIEPLLTFIQICN